MSVIAEHRGALAADLRRYYQASIDGLRFENPFEVAAWIEHLPPDSAVRRARGDGWSLADHLLATVVDSLQVANWQRVAAGTPKGKTQPPFPKPIPRPGDGTGKERKAKITGAQLLEFRRRTRDNESG